MGEAQEDTLRNHSDLIEKEEVSFFCYLIIDPTMLPEAVNCSFRQFVRSIFYVGKGNRSRPLQHLVEAHCRRRKLVDDPSQQVWFRLRSNGRAVENWDSTSGFRSPTS
jgi:hypothetical protein